jgi:hypothetical protein
MTAQEKLCQLIQTLPEKEVSEILNFAESLWPKVSSPKIPAGTLTGLRGIAQQPGAVPSDGELETEYADYLTNKYL